MLDTDTIRKLDQVVATFVEVAATTHYSLYQGYIRQGFSEEQAFELVADYAIHHNNGLTSIAVLVAAEDEPSSAVNNIDEATDEELPEEDL